MKTHKKTHLKMNDILCDICPFKTSSKAALYTHGKNIHGKFDKEDFKCEHCGLNCTSKPGLNSHILIVHTGLQKFKCDQCDFNSGYGDSLKNHIGRYHQNVKTGCTMCPWQGLQISQHMRSAHLPKKSQSKKCDICNMEYVNERNLQLHKERAHLGVRHSCPQ